MPSDADRTGQELSNILDHMYKLRGGDPTPTVNELTDALGLIWMAYPTILDKGKMLKILKTIRHELKEGREGEEWKEPTDD